ncbi:DNA-binding protein [Nocardia zapadnayensis]|nr:DNA-binding protein [Nocardia zapadnayensis]MCX0277266.1 DNA-binding protein [Nocardia zapadnayensis]
MAELWLSADDIAANLGVTKDTAYTSNAEKAVPAHKVGRPREYQDCEIDELVRAGAAASSAEPKIALAVVNGQPYSDSNETDAEGADDVE